MKIKNRVIAILALAPIAALATQFPMNVDAYFYPGDNQAQDQCHFIQNIHQFSAANPTELKVDTTYSKVIDLRKLNSASPITLLTTYAINNPPPDCLINKAVVKNGKTIVKANIDATNMLYPQYTAAMWNNFNASTGMNATQKQFAQVLADNYTLPANPAAIANKTVAALTASNKSWASPSATPNTAHFQGIAFDVEPPDNTTANNVSQYLLDISHDFQSADINLPMVIYINPATLICNPQAPHAVCDPNPTGTLANYKAIMAANPNNVMALGSYLLNGSLHPKFIAAATLLIQHKIPFKVVLNIAPSAPYTRVFKQIYTTVKPQIGGLFKGLVLYDWSAKQADHTAQMTALSACMKNPEGC